MQGFVTPLCFSKSFEECIFGDRIESVEVLLLCIALSFLALPPTYQSLYGEFRKVDNPRSLAQFLGKAFTALINTGRNLDFSIWLLMLFFSFFFFFANLVTFLMYYFKKFT